MAETTLQMATEMRVGRYCIFDGKACIVKSIQTSKPGKHGHAKCRIEAVSIIDGSKIIKIMPGHEKIEVPIIEKKSAQVLSIAGDKATVMDSASFETFEVTISDELQGQVKEGGNILYWIVLDQKVLKEVKA